MYPKNEQFYIYFQISKQLIKHIIKLYTLKNFDNGDQTYNNAYRRLSVSN